MNYATEKDLCSAFTEHCIRDGLMVYAETGGFDMLVVYPDGKQLGIEAKLRLNEKVLSQILPSPSSWFTHKTGPNHRAVLVPKVVDGSPLLDLLAYVGIDVITADHRNHFDYVLRKHIDRHEFSIAEKLHDWNPEKQCKLPEYVPDVIGGASGPVKLTEWKIAALKIMADLELDGFVTRENFKRYGINHRRWTNTDGWLRSRSNGEWVKGSADFHLQHPTVYMQILEKARSERTTATVKRELEAA